ncbi:MAG: hypothetical protein KJ638_07810 [Chloroflexi bacterium]|nr:hypothetical protein [Chloroflexota bacterium]
MNIYVLVEGERASKRIYKNWISYVNSDLIPIDYLSDFSENNFYILAGYGQPYFFERIDKAVVDANNIDAVDRLVIAVDSEDQEYHEKFAEISNRVDKIGCKVEVRIVIQHFCIETWLLGNKTNFRKKPCDEELLSFSELFDIRNNDPELLPPHNNNSWNRAQFAYHFFKAGIRDVYSGRQSYTKRNPGFSVGIGFFNQVKSRCVDEGHIKSFDAFMTAFQ